MDEAARQGRVAGCLAWESSELPPPVGYSCTLAGPDDNLVEFSFGQGVADAASTAGPGAASEG